MRPGAICALHPYDSARGAVGILVIKRDAYGTRYFACNGCIAIFLNVNLFNGLHSVGVDIEAPPVVVQMQCRR